MSKRRRFAGLAALVGALVLSFGTPSIAAAQSAARPAQSSPAAHTAQTDAPTSSPQPAPAESQEPAPAEKDSLSSAQHIALAQTLFQQQKYAEAGDHLRAAHEQSPNAVLLFNAGQAYRKALRPKEARDSYQQMITTYPDHPLVPEAKGYVQTLDALIAEVQAKQQIELSLQQQKQLSEKELAEERLRREEIQKELSKYKKPYYKSAWFWLLISGAVLTVGTVIAIPVGVNSQSKTDGGTQHLTFSLTY